MAIILLIVHIIPTWSVGMVQHVGREGDPLRVVGASIWGRYLSGCAVLIKSHELPTEACNLKHQNRARHAKGPTDLKEAWNVGCSVQGFAQGPEAQTHGMGVCQGTHVKGS